MTWKASVLVVANVTARSAELLDALRARAAKGPTSFTLLVPTSDASPAALADAEFGLESALEHLRGAGLEVEGKIADPDPVLAVREEYDPRRYDEIIVGTLPSGTSKWLQIDLPHRIERITGAPVTHCISAPPAPTPAVSAAPAHEPPGVLAPLNVLSWGSTHHRQ
jgi:hypothetical protein